MFQAFLRCLPVALRYPWCATRKNRCPSSRAERNLKDGPKTHPLSQAAWIFRMMTKLKVCCSGLFFWLFCLSSHSAVSAVDTQPRSVVPDIAGSHDKTFPWSNYKDVRGIIVNEGPRKENRICYVQGICVKTIQLAGTIWGKSAYMVTVRIDEEKKIDLDVNPFSCLFVVSLRISVSGVVPAEAHDRRPRHHCPR